MKTTFDYIVCGGGSAGCALAAWLSENPDLNVCLIEAGGRGRDLFIRMPAGNGFVFGNPKLDWGYETIPQPSLNGRKIYYARGKSLGGSSIMNGMIYMRGVPADYDAWRQMGLNGWGYNDLLPYFLRSECARDRRDPWHGTSGPLKTEQSENFGELDRAFVEAAQAAGHRLIDDFNGPERTGVARTDSTVHGGIRQSSAIAYLTNPPRNLTILTHTQIARVMFEGSRAMGVETLSGKELRANAEVILCQGAFGTPQTLMLSGIDPADHLAETGIDVRVDLPGVGSNLADHLDVSMQYASDRLDLSLARFQRFDQAVKLMLDWLLFKKGPGGGAFFSSVIFHAFSDPALPELEIYMTPMVIEENLTSGADENTPLLQWLGRKMLVRGRKVARPGVQIDINQERPRSLGTVRLVDDNPRTHPLIDANYYDDPRDLDEVVQGVHMMRDLMAKPQIARYLTGEMAPWKDARTDVEIEEAVRNTTYTGHHPCGTAKIGVDNDPLAVLDGDFRVRGTQGLRVCDASAFPTQITGNLNATVIMMAEKAADVILGREPLPAFYPEEKVA